MRRHLCPAGSSRSYALEVVTGAGYDLELMAELAGALLAKDVALLDELFPGMATSLTTTARAAVARMGLQ